MAQRVDRPGLARYIAENPLLTDARIASDLEVSVTTVWRMRAPYRGNVGMLISQVIYFIRDEAFVKIGISNDPAWRLRALQIGSPRTLELLGWIEGGREEESRLHELFTELNVRGEWFRYEEPLVSWIERALPN